MLHENMDQKTPEPGPEQPVAVPDDEAQAEQVDPKDAVIAQLSEERDALKDEMVRALAEAQNIQRRLREQHEQALKFATEPLVRELLPVLDNFERTLEASKSGASPEQVLKGVKQVEKQLRQALGKVKVERIKAVGHKFDPEVHEALATTVSEEHEEETVSAEIEPGYKMQDRVIRPARVQVTKKP